MYKEKFEVNCLKDKKYCKIRDHCHHTAKYRGAGRSLCYLIYSVPKKVFIAFHNGFKYDFHFIIKKLAEAFEKEFTCLGENTEKYITFTVPIEKEVTRIDKNGDKTIKNVSYIMQFIDNARFIAISLSHF